MNDTINKISEVLEATTYAERQVIGCLLLACAYHEISGKDLQPDVLAVLEPKHFSDWSKHNPGFKARMYAALKGCWKEHKSTDLATLLKYLADKGLATQNDKSYLLEIMGDTLSTFDAVHYANAVKDAYLKRAIKYFSDRGDYERVKKILANEIKGGYEL